MHYDELRELQIAPISIGILGLLLIKIENIRYLKRLENKELSYKHAL